MQTSPPSPNIGFPLQTAARGTKPNQTDGQSPCKHRPTKARLESHALDATQDVFTTDIDAPGLLTAEFFDRLWQLRPAEPPRIRMLGRIVPLPRRQKAFARDYAFSGTVSVAADIPDALAPFLFWAQNALDARLNGLLLNWLILSQGSRSCPPRVGGKALLRGFAPTLGLKDETPLALLASTTRRRCSGTTFIHTLPRRDETFRLDETSNAG